MIITLCGSLKFKWKFKDVKKKLEFFGYQVYTPQFFKEGVAKPPIEELVKEHQRKINLADIVFIVNVNGYIGEDTRNEIQYAEKHNKKIIYLEPV